MEMALANVFDGAECRVQKNKNKNPWHISQSTKYRRKIAIVIKIDRQMDVTRSPDTCSTMERLDK